MEFYHSVFGGTLALSTFAEFHVSEDAAQQDKIMHGVLTGDNGVVLMGADTPNSMELTANSSRRREADEGPVGRHLRHVQRQVRRALAGQHFRGGPAGVACGGY